MLFHSEGSELSICQHIGIGNFCISTGFAELPQEEKGKSALSLLCEKEEARIRPQVQPL